MLGVSGVGITLLFLRNKACLAVRPKTARHSRALQNWKQRSSVPGHSPPMLYKKKNLHFMSKHVASPCSDSRSDHFYCYLPLPITSNKHAGDCGN